MFAMGRRLLTGKHPFKRDRGHLHHRLIDMGFNQTQSVRILYAVSAILGISSVMLITHQIAYAIIIIAVSLAISVVMWIIFRDGKMKYESGLMDKPDEPELNEENTDLIIEVEPEDGEKNKEKLKPGKAKR